MLRFENTTVYGFAEAIRGMRNPIESHDKIDSREKIFISFDNIEYNYDATNPLVASIVMKPVTNKRYSIEPLLGPNDLDLMERLVKAGTEHAKFMRMLTVYCDITGPLYWWKEFDTYKIGTVANSYSTMHKIQAHEFTVDMFSHEHLFEDSIGALRRLCEILNHHRNKFLETGDKNDWWQMIQLLPSSFNQKRTVMMNYQVLSSIYYQRKSHKLDEWRTDFMKWIDTLPYSHLIKLEKK